MTKDANGSVIHTYMAMWDKNPSELLTEILDMVSVAHMYSG